MRRNGSGVQIELDSENEAIYIRLSTNQIRSTKPFGEDVLIDLDGRGHPVGLEILDPDRISAALRHLRSRYRVQALRGLRPEALQSVFVG